MHLLAASLVVVLALAGLAAPPAAAGTLASGTWTTQITGYFGDSTFAVPVVATGTASDTAIAVSLPLPAFEKAVSTSRGRRSPLSYRRTASSGWAARRRSRVALSSVKAGGSFALTAQGGGTVTLVAPARIAIDSTGSYNLAQQRTVASRGAA